jgi:hypothetical protein
LTELGRRKGDSLLPAGTRPKAAPIVILSHFQTPSPNKAFQPKCLGKPHEMAGIQDDNLTVVA